MASVVGKVSPPFGPKPCTDCDCIIWVSRATENWPGQAASSCAGCTDVTVRPNIGSSNPVRYWDGAIYLGAVDIKTPYGGFLDHVRTYNNKVAYGGFNGHHWFVRSIPYLFSTGTGTNDTAAVVFDPNNPFWFKKSATAWDAQYGAQDVTLAYNSGTMIWTFVMNTSRGSETTRFNGDGDPLDYTDAAGVVTTFTYSSGYPSDLTRIINDGTNDIYENVHYDYYSSGGGTNKIQYALYRRKTGSGGSWTNIQRVEYTYYDNASSNGQAGDLESAAVQIHDGTKWDTKSLSYYRYYLSTAVKGFLHGLKLHIGPEGNRRAWNASVNVFTAADSAIDDYADHYFEYDPTSKNVTAETAAVCASCPGGGTTQDLFAYAARTGGPYTGENTWASKTTQTLPNGATIKVYSNAVGMPMLEEYASGSDTWYRYWRYNSGNSVTLVAESSAIDPTKISESNNDLVNYDGGTNSAIRASTGLVRTASYYGSTLWHDTDDGLEVAGYLNTEAVQQGRTGSSVALRKHLYDDNTAGGNTIYLPRKLRVYPSSSGTGTYIDTLWEYTFHTGTNEIATRTTTFPSTSSQNGTAATTMVETFDTYGNRTQVTDQLSKVHKYEYDVVLRVMTKSIINYVVSPSAPGDSFTTEYTYDQRGRLTSTMGPAHTIDLSGTATSVRTMSWVVSIESGKPATLGSSAWDMDQQWSAPGYRTGSGPYTYTLVNPVTIARLGKDGRTIDAITAARASTSGALSASDSFAQSTWKSWTHHEITDQGRLTSTRVYHLIPSAGTGSSPTNYGATSFEYDSLERVIKRTAPGGTITYTVWSAPQRVKEVWVGTNATGATQTSPGQGGANNNNLKKVTANQYDGGSAGGDGTLTQVTQYPNDTSGQERVTSFTYDFRNRRTVMDGEEKEYAAFTYDNLDRVTQVDRRDTTSSGDLIGRTTTSYDDLGRVYEQRTYSVESNTPGNYLTASTWHDELGRPYRQVAAGAGNVFTHTTYNGAGWATAEYRGVGTSTSISSNVITTQTENTYDDGGNVISTAFYDRLNSTSDTTTDKLTTTNARVSYVAIYPDAIGRVHTSVNYGVLSSFTRSSTIPTRNDARLITDNTFDDAGRLATVIDPADARLVTVFDAAGRKTAVIEDFLGIARETDYTYTLDNLIATQVALNSDTGNQTTTYTYGSTLTNSDVARNDLLVNVAYPDSTGSSDTVTATYNRLGQRKKVTDQRGTVHDYEYDKLGRQLEDKVSTLGGVDDYVRRIQQQYEARGMVEKVTSHSATSGGSVRNEVQYAYNGFGQLTTEYQEHGGAVNTGTSVTVQYAYESGASGGSQTNQIRPTTLTYPDGRVITYGYGTSGSLNDKISRAASITDTTGSTTLTEYTYLGSGLAVRVKYPQPDVWLDLWGGSGSTFTGLDLFNRVTDQKWQNAVSTTPVTIDRYQYTYDRMSNRLTRTNALQSTLSETYGYDTLNRLISMDRGSGGATRTEDWNLDATGNWLNYDTTISSVTDLTQTRTANAVNEITDITSTPTWADPAYDAAGNMTSFVKPSSPSSNLTATYDAWNRLVKVADGANTVVEYRFDGNRRRVIRLGYAGGILSETRHFYLSNQWQDLEERVGTSTAATYQYVWGPRYVDDLLCRIGTLRYYAALDDNYNVTSALTTAGVVAERYSFDSYGSRFVMTALWGSLGASVLDWTYGFQGLRIDESFQGWLARNRYFTSTLGTWVQRDRRSVLDGPNLYTVMDSAPQRRLDPFGLEAMPAGGGDTATPSCEPAAPVDDPEQPNPCASCSEWSPGNEVFEFAYSEKEGLHTCKCTYKLCLQWTRTCPEDLGTWYWGCTTATTTCSEDPMMRKVKYFQGSLFRDNCDEVCKGLSPPPVQEPSLTPMPKPEVLPHLFPKPKPDLQWCYTEPGLKPTGIWPPSGTGVRIIRGICRFIF